MIIKRDRLNECGRLIFKLSEDLPFKCLLSTLADIPVWCGDVETLVSKFNAEYLGKRVLTDITGSGVYNVYIIPEFKLDDVTYVNLPIGIFDYGDPDYDMILCWSMFNFCNISSYGEEARVEFDFPDECKDTPIKCRTDETKGVLLLC